MASGPQRILIDDQDQDPAHDSLEIRSAPLQVIARSCRQLAMYIERRSHDSESLFYYGQTMERLGNAA